MSIGNETPVDEKKSETYSLNLLALEYEKEQKEKKLAELASSRMRINDNYQVDSETFKSPKSITIIKSKDTLGSYA